MKDGLLRSKRLLEGKCFASDEERKYQKNSTKELMSWYNQISSLPKLKINVAQELYRKAINAQDEMVKKKYMEELILGTVYVVYEYIERNGLELLVSSSYDMNDIISSFNSVWIKKLYNGELLNVDKYSLLFTSPYFNEVYNNLCGDEILVNEQLGVSTNCLIELITLYIAYRNKGLEKPFREVIEETFFTDRRNSWSYCIYKNVIKTIPLLERIYNNLNFDKLGDINMGKTKITDYLRLIINMGLIEPISNEIIDENDMEDSVTTDIVMSHFVEDIDKILDDRQRTIIHERYGLDDCEPQVLEKVGQHHGITSERVRQFEAKSLRKIRSKRDFAQKYKEAVM